MTSATSRGRCWKGVAFGLRDGLDLMVGAGLPAPTQIRASGGGVRSALWRQILADVLEAEIATVPTEEGAAYGAALLAAVGAEWFDTVEARLRSRGKVMPADRPRRIGPALSECPHPLPRFVSGAGTYFPCHSLNRPHPSNQDESPGGIWASATILSMTTRLEMASWGSVGTAVPSRIARENASAWMPY